MCNRFYQFIVLSIMIQHPCLFAGLPVEQPAEFPGFFYPPTIQVTPSVRDLEFADLNNDQLPDLIYVDQQVDALFIHLQNSDGTFAERIFFETQDFPGSIIISDFDSDGIPDIVVPGAAFLRDEPFVTLFGTGDYQNPTSLFGSPVRYVLDDVFNSNQIDSIVLDDFNGDQIPDLLGERGTDILLIEGNGDGTFRQPVTIISMEDENNGFGISFSAVHVNNDGRLDFLVRVNSQSYRVILSNDEGMYSVLESFEPGSNLFFSSVIDINSDNIPDMIYPSNQNMVEIRFGIADGDHPSGMFAEAIGLFPGSDPEDVVVEDFNSDGLLDIGVMLSRQGLFT